jgi:hypothetical protein
MASRPRPSLLALFDPLVEGPNADLIDFSGAGDAGLDEEASDKENDVPTLLDGVKGTPLAHKRRLVDVDDPSQPPTKRAPFTEITTTDALLLNKGSPTTPSGTLFSPLSGEVTSLVTLHSPTTPIASPTKTAEVAPSQFSPLFLAPPPALEKRELPDDVPSSADTSSSSITLTATNDSSFSLLSNRLSLVSIGPAEEPLIPADLVEETDPMDEDTPPTAEEKEDMARVLAQREVEQMKKEGRWLFGTKPPGEDTEPSMEDDDEPILEAMQSASPARPCTLLFL